MPNTTRFVNRRNVGTVQRRNEPTSIVTMVTGLIGGLVTGMKLILTRVVQIPRYISRRRGRHIQFNVIAANKKRNSSRNIGLVFLGDRGSSIHRDTNQSLPSVADTH
jgi:hypothetical protein